MRRDALMLRKWAMWCLCGVLGAALAAWSASSASAADPAADAKPSAPLVGVERVRADAARMLMWCRSDLSKNFLGAARALPEVTPRTLYVNRATRTWYTPAERDALGEAERDALEPRDIDESYYYTTRYGSPLAYVRALDLLAAHDRNEGGFGGANALRGKRVIDYGYGTIGHLRLMASLGAHCVGLDTDPSLARLYSQPGDTGVIPAAEGDAAGFIELKTGRFPVDTGCTPKDLLSRFPACDAPNAGGDAPSPDGNLRRGFDLFLSKNTLKNGYINPNPPDGQRVDPRMLVDLGTDAASFLNAVHDVLAPGGLFMIYNLSPAPSKPGEAYKPWSDGRCPFTREQLENAGFTVLAFDEIDDGAARDMGRLLGWDADPDGDGPRAGSDLESDLFAHWTLARKRDRR